MSVDCCIKRNAESSSSGPPSKLFKTSHGSGDTSNNVQDLEVDWMTVQERLEKCMEVRCLCSLKLDELIDHLIPFLTNSCSQEQNLLVVNFIEWAASSLHDDLGSGFVCGSTQVFIHHVLQSTNYLDQLLVLTKIGDPYLRYCSSQAISSLLPLSYCGQDTVLPSAQLFLQNVINQLQFSTPSMTATTNLHNTSTTTMLPDIFAGLHGSGDHLVCASMPELDLMMNGSSSSPVDSQVSELDLEKQLWLIRILHDFVSHANKQKDEQSPERDMSEACSVSELEDEMLCQEIQIKCAIIKLLEPVWEKFTSNLSHIISKHSAPSQSLCITEILYATEGFKLWRALISVRANLNFVDSRNFSSNLSSPVHQLKKNTPSVVWNEVLDTLSECLCYGSTLGLQSIPPEEPCQLAHTLIRLVRFDGFLNRVPYSNQSKGFGGSCQLPASQMGLATNMNMSSAIHDNEEVNDDIEDENYNKALVQRIILLVLKSVALTTREARVDSSSGESDSSLSSHESGSSCSSDLVIIERNMNGVYKQLDRWIKTILPVLPDTSLQDNILNLLQEQDDVLIEGLLCLLDTYIALQHPSRDTTQVLPESCPTKGFIKFMSLVGSDSSVLLDFLVSNETCFLLYFLRYLKFILKDWTQFVISCGSSYKSTINIILHLKSSIQRLLTKDLFPYNIAPVYKLLDRIQNIVDQTK